MLNENAELNGLLDKIERVIENARTLVIRTQANQTECFDENDEDAKAVFGIGELIIKVGVIALYHWDEVAGLLPDDLRAEVEKLMCEIV